jgi:quinohemoprotein ethanol dehydrogenase
MLQLAPVPAVRTRAQRSWQWRTALKSGLSPRSGNQAQPIVHDDVIYIMTGENDAFAVSVETGAILWEYRAKIDPQVARPCCSWVGRSVGFGDGKIFVGQLDAKLMALDAKTGAVTWSIQAEDPSLWLCSSRFQPRRHTRPKTRMW